MNNGYPNAFGLNTIPPAMRGNQQIVGGNNQLVGGSQYYPSGQQQSFYPQPVNFGQQQNQSSVQSNESNTNIIWMQGGINTVKSAMMPNGSQFAYWDQDENKIFVKTVDQYGKSTVETLVYFSENELPQVLQQNQQVDAQQSGPVLDTSVYVTQEQLTELQEQLSKQITEVQRSLNNFKSKVGNMNKKENSK